MALLRELKRKADQSSMTLQAEFHRSMAEMQEMHQEFEVSKCFANAQYDILFYVLIFFPSQLVCLPILLCLFHIATYFKAAFIHLCNKNKMLCYSDSQTVEYILPHNENKLKTPSKFETIAWWDKHLANRTNGRGQVQSLLDKRQWHD